MPRSIMRGIPGISDGWAVDNDPAFMMLDIMTRIWSPAQLNPMKVNPLRDLLAKQVDFEGLRARPDVKLFVTASNVRTCKSRLFRTPELTADTLMASACLPFLFEAVEIEGEFYWDGGYLGNPAIYPLIHECSSSDVVIVQINPTHAQRGAGHLARHPEPHQRDDLQRQPGARDGGHRHRHQPGGKRQAQGRPLHRGTLPPDQRRDRARQDGRAQQDEHRALVPAAPAWPRLRDRRPLAQGQLQRIGWESTVDVLDKYM
jgi:predicted acylesterase/phospholipase RssA